MANGLLLLRNKLHKDSLRFDLDNDLRAMDYLPGERETSNMIEIVQEGALKGYAVFSELMHGEVKAYKVLEICAMSGDVFDELINLLIERAVRDKVDFIYTKGSDERFNDILFGKGFFSFLESAVMTVLLNPYELLSSLSEKVNQGKILNIAINGFDPVLLRIGEKGVMVITDGKPDLTVRTDSKTFIKLFFGKTSFSKQLFQGKVRINSLTNLPTAMHFFTVIKQQHLYIPLGDWL